MLIVVVTGLLLQVKKEFAWIQPPTERGVSIENRSPLSLNKLLEIVREVPEAQVACLLYTSPSPRDRQKTRMPSSA